MIGGEEVEDCDKGGRGTEDITKRLSKAQGAFFNLEKILVGIQKSNYTIWDIDTSIVWMWSMKTNSRWGEETGWIHMP